MKIIFLLLLFISFNALAIIPPISEDKVIQKSNVVIKGETLEIKKMGDQIDSGCMIKTPYQAKIKVLKVYKGSPEKEITLDYTYRKLKKRCSGQPYYGTFKGEKKKFYLRCSDNKNCRVSHIGMIEKNR